MNEKDIQKLALGQLKEWCEIWDAEIRELQDYGTCIKIGNEIIYFENCSINCESINDWLSDES